MDLGTRLKRPADTIVSLLSLCSTPARAGIRDKVLSKDKARVAAVVDHVGVSALMFARANVFLNVTF